MGYSFDEPEVTAFVLFIVILKAELESLPLSCILETKAVLDSCAYDSVLTMSVQQRSKRVQVFVFQCEETGVSHFTFNLSGSRVAGPNM